MYPQLPPFGFTLALAIMVFETFHGLTAVAVVDTYPDDVYYPLTWISTSFPATEPSQVIPSGNFTTMVNEPIGAHVAGNPVKLYVTRFPAILVVGVTVQTGPAEVTLTTCNVDGTKSCMEMDEVPAGAENMIV